MTSHFSGSNEARTTIFILFFFQVFGISKLKYTITNTEIFPRDLVRQNDVILNMTLHFSVSSEARVLILCVLGKENR